MSPSWKMLQLQHAVLREGVNGPAILYYYTQTGEALQNCRGLLRSPPRWKEQSELCRINTGGEEGKRWRKSNVPSNCSSELSRQVCCLTHWNGDAVAGPSFHTSASAPATRSRIPGIHSSLGLCTGPQGEADSSGCKCFNKFLNHL